MTSFRPFFNPATGEWIEYTTVAEDSNGELVRFTWRSMPGGVISEHVHPHQEERFTIVSGTAILHPRREADHRHGRGHHRRAPRCSPLRGESRHRRDHRRGRAPPGSAHQGVPRGARRTGGRREDDAPGGAQEPLAAWCHLLALPPREQGDLPSGLGPEPGVPAPLGGGQGVRSPPYHQRWDSSLGTRVPTDSSVADPAPSNPGHGAGS